MITLKPKTIIGIIGLCVTVLVIVLGHEMKQSAASVTVAKEAAAANAETAKVAAEAKRAAENEMEAYKSVLRETNRRYTEIKTDIRGIRATMETLMLRIGKRKNDG